MNKCSLTSAGLNHFVLHCCPVVTKYVLISRITYPFLNIQCPVFFLVQNCQPRLNLRSRTLRLTMTQLCHKLTGINKTGIFLYLLLALKYSEKNSVTFVNSIKSIEAYQPILCVNDVGSAKLYEAGKIPYALHKCL